MSATGSIQEKNGKYYAVINFKDEKGNRKQKWINTNIPVRGGKKKALAFLREQLDKWDKYNIAYQNLTVDEYFEQWIEMIKPEVRANTYHSYYANMKNHIIPYFKKHKIYIQELKPYQLEDYYKSKNSKNSKLKTEDALSTTTIKHHHQNISKALNDAVRRGIIYYNPAASARTPKQEKFKGDFLTVQQVKELLLLFKGSTIEIPVVLCAIYGFRRSEVLALKWCNVDLKGKSITVKETLQQNVGGDYTDTVKTESSYRTMPMNNDVYKVLKEHRDVQKQRKKIMGQYYIDSNYVCTFENGKLISPNYLTRTFHSIISKSDLPCVRLHDLRHSVASNLLNSGFSVVQVAQWLGHSSAATTLNYYAHVDKTSKMDIAAALEKIVPLK